MFEEERDAFVGLKRYLKRIKYPTEVKYLDERTVEFTIKTRAWEKYFRVHYQDGFSEGTSEWDKTTIYTFPRDRYQYYNVYFCQENYPLSDGDIGAIEGDRWKTDEEDMLDEVRRLYRNWRK